MSPQPAAPLAAESILPLGYFVDQTWSAGRRHFMHARPVHAGAEGVRSYMHSDAGLCVSSAQMRYERATAETFPCSTEVMKVHVRLSGASRVGHEHEAGRPVREMSCSALIQPRGDAKFEHFDGTVQERSVTVACSAEFLSEDFGLDGQALPARIVRFLEGGEGPLSGIDVPLLLETRRAAEVILEELALGTARPLMIEARALELLARFFEHARGIECGVAPPPLQARDRRIAELARVHIEEHFADPPSLKELAREVGTHPAKLMRLFKAVHGSTISDYLEALRMERARRLLAQGDLPVTQIAFEVGYEHPSNFATAFKRRFGTSPSAVRGQARAPLAA